MRQLLLLFFLLPLALSAQTPYTMAGPYETIARDGQYARTKGGSERDMRQALLFAQKGDTAALPIIRAYARTLRAVDGHDAPLCAIQGYDLVRAMTLMQAHRQTEWDDMVRRVWLPLCDRFEQASPYANGNWGAIVNRLRMACGIYLQDSTVYAHSIDYFLHADDNGALPRYILPSGQCQETGRDQAHAQLGLEALCDQCEMAYAEGDDLYAALDCRLMKGIEYTARYNLGYDVPFERVDDCTGLYSEWTVPSTFNRGRLWDIYERPYRHYVGRLHMKMPYTKQAIEVLKGKRKNKATEGERVHQLFAYAAPEGAPLAHDYKVYAKAYGAKEWTRIDTYSAPVARGGRVSYAQFDFTGNALIRVVRPGRPYREARVRPDYRGVICQHVNDTTVEFMFFQRENVSLEFDGDTQHCLHLFTSRPPLTADEARGEAEARGQRFVRIPKGYYGTDRIADLKQLVGSTKAPVKADVTESSAPVDTNVVTVPSATYIYMEAGTYIDGTLAVEDEHDVTLLGRAILRPSRGYEGVHVHRSRRVLVDGLTLCTLPIGGSDSVVVRDVRSISHPSWGDGLNVFASSHILYDRVYCRNSDDCTTAYATRKGFHGSTRHVVMRNATLWADVAHPIFIGIHGDALRGDTIEDLRYENIDIMGQWEPQLDYQGCLAINAGDNNLVRRVLFSNIRVEDIHEGSLFQFKVGYNKKYCAAPGRAVEDITVRNLRLYGHQPRTALILGYDESRRIRRVTFEGLRLNGRPIYDQMPGKPGYYKTADLCNTYVNDLVDELTFKK